MKLKDRTRKGVGCEGSAKNCSTNLVRSPIVRIKVAGWSLDFRGLLASAITLLATNVAALSRKSRELVATALARLMETYSKYHLQTLDELIDLAFSAPGFIQSHSLGGSVRN